MSETTEEAWCRRCDSAGTHWDVSRNAMQTCELCDGTGKDPSRVPAIAPAIPSEPQGVVLTEPDGIRCLRTWVRMYEKEDGSKPVDKALVLEDARRVVQYVDALRTQLRRAEGERDASGDAERWRGLCAFVDFAGHSGGGYVVLFSHKGIGDDPPSASIQIVESFQNPHKVRVYKEGWDLPAAYDALVPGYLPKDLNSLPAARVVEAGSEAIDVWPHVNAIMQRICELDPGDYEIDNIDTIRVSAKELNFVLHDELAARAILAAAKGV